ncbi:cation diffusion facilitator family transporter [Tepidimonas charontis]|uniref:cation diffusion facilitator family transporter n=1 Tax=Tepidimonas charontis TaxID=2267262 RepID=UPI001F3F4838|nr:cation diffusion facilitator family transporter [Tepidimonas charontis]
MAKGDAHGADERHVHDHAHAPIHGHVHGADTGGWGRRFALGVALNLGFVAVEAVSGWLAGSLALLADAAHNLSDVAGLLLAWGAYAAARLRPNDRHTYGWRRGSILAGFVNAVVLLAAMGWLWWEAGTRLLGAAAAPAPGIVIAVAAVGVLINGLTAALFMAGGRRDLNLRGAFLHMAADALISLGVVLAGVLTWWSGWGWIDPAVSLVIAGVIIAGTLPLARQTLHLLFDGVPAGIELSAVRQALLRLPGVASVHDLHVWALGTGGPDDVALTAHLVLGPDAPSAETVLAEAARVLHAQGVGHTTLQIETTACGAGCATAAVGSDRAALHAGAGAA